MNFEQHDNFLLADWTCPSTPLSADGQAEIAQLEDFLKFAVEQYKAEKIQAVLWLQKVPCYDASQQWLNELSENLLRDQLRARMLRLHKLARNIRNSEVPWIYATEKDCFGSMFELMLACRKRFVFDRETWFGFPEFAIGQISPLGWLGSQLRRQPAMAKAWSSRSVLSAEEAVQSGIITAALTWRDWRRNLLHWMQQQIQELEAEGSKPRGHTLHDSWRQDLWQSKELGFQGKTHVDTYLGLSSYALQETTVDRDLIDTAAHFMLQAPYEKWLRQEIWRRKLWGRQSIPRVIAFEVSDGLPPMATVARLLERGVQTIWLARNAEKLRQAVEVVYQKLGSRYARSELQRFSQQIAWYVGPEPAEPQQPLMKFGAFREFSCRYRRDTIRGWSMLSSRGERQAVEIDGAELSGPLRSLSDLFDGIYVIHGTEAEISLLFRVRSLILQMLVYYCQDASEDWPDVLEQLKGLGWHLLGSARFWQSFLAYRAQKLPRDQSPGPIGAFRFDYAILMTESEAELLKLCGKTNPGELSSGPGYLHRSLMSFISLLSEELQKQGLFPSLDLADLYLSDALGVPKTWGSTRPFVRRLGTLREAEARFAMEVRTY